MSKVQSWVETTDPILFGRNGDMGIVREHQKDRDERQATAKVMKLMALVITLAGGLPGLLLLGQMLHILPRW